MSSRTDSFESFSGRAKRAINARALVSLLAVTSATSAACGDLSESGTDAVASTDALAGGKATYLEQGWDEATRSAFYQTTEGSRMLPYDWFLHLEQANSAQKLRSPKNILRMGYLVGEVSDANPDGLPVGFARDVDAVRGDAIGLTCAGCHTGELTFRGKRVRIDGGQSFGDVEQLQAAILGSLEATLADDKKFKKFVKDLTKHADENAPVIDQVKLRADMEAQRTKWQARIARSRGQTPHGPTRTDALTIIGNEVVCDLFQDPRNCTPNSAVAPTQFPPLWNTSDLEWVQYNSSVHSPIGRNVGQVTGTFAEATLDTTSPLAQAGLIVKSSANVGNLHRLETFVKSLRSPTWPENLLGSIDRELAVEGEALYDSNCAGCHDPNPARTGPNRFGRTFARVDFSTPLSELGTDSTAAVSFATRRAYPGPFTIPAQANNLIGADGKAPVAALLSISGTMILQRFFATPPLLSDVEKLQYMDLRESPTPTTAQLLTYKARPLNGAVFTAPYLHNGSVASLHELLLPPAERMKDFCVGSTEFDPTDVGFSTRCEEGSVLLDTTALGNSNGGHVYGTNLSDDQRFAVIEYMKTL